MVTEREAIFSMVVTERESKTMREVNWSALNPLLQKVAGFTNGHS